MTAYLGIDIGTTNAKALLCDAGGQVIASAQRSYPTYKRATTWVEQEPDDWWTATCTAVADLAARASLQSVAAVAFSAHAPTLLAVDSQGRALRPAMIWMDRRAEPQCRELEAQFGASDYLRKAGNRIDPFYVGPKLMWLRDHEPEILRAAAAFLQIPGYLASRLTGEFSLDVAHASILGLGAPNDWDPDLVNHAGIRPEQLPPSLAGSAVVGHTMDGALPGIRAGVPVAAGTVDSAAASLEVDLRSHEALLMTGTSSVLVMPRSKPRPSPEFISMALSDGGWCDLAAVVSSGASVQWLAQLASLELADFMTLAAQSEPGARGLLFLPYLAGERSPWWDTAARGGFIGLTGMHTLADLARSVLEGTALALRQNLKIARNAGHDIRQLAANGGPARSPFWNQITADVIGLPIVSHHVSGGSAFGCCRLAARSVGEQMPPMPGSKEETLPDSGAHARYTQLSDIYDQLYPTLRDTSRRLAELTEE